MNDKPKNNFASKVFDSKKNIFLVNANDEGNPCWYYLKIWDEKLIQFKKSLEQKEKVNLTDFGRIIHSGYGKEPPEYISKTLKNMNLI